MQRICEINEAIQSNKISDVVLLSGLTMEMVEEMTMPEVFEAVSVRLNDMMKSVGIQ